MPDAQADLFDFRYSLPNLTESLKKQRRIKIVAIGSSSTAGEADVLPYPSRLEMLCATVSTTA
jgi:acyl-CoA thioesterase I